MSTPNSEAAADLQSQLDALLKFKDELLAEHPKDSIGPEEQKVWDRISAKLEKLSVLAKPAAGVEGAAAGQGSLSPESAELMVEFELLADQLELAKSSVDTEAAEKCEKLAEMFLAEAKDKPAKAASVLALLRKTLDQAIEAGLDGAAAGAGGAGKTISGSVGRGGKNAKEDVQTVQQLLNDDGSKLAVDGLIGPKTIGAIKAFQSKTFGWDDSLVEPGKQTITALNGGGVSEGETEGAAAGGEAGAGAAAEPEDVPGIGLMSGGGSEPTVVDGNPNDPDVMEELLKDQLDGQPDAEATVDVKDENGDVLAFPEFPFVRDQEISIGIKLSNAAQGELKVKFNEKGQIEVVAVSRPVIPGVGIAVSPYGILCKGEFKPLSCEIKLSKSSSELVCELEVSTSGGMMVGLGAAKGDSWIGLGSEVELKVSRTETLTAKLAFDIVKQAIMGNIPTTALQLNFNLPAELVFSGAQNLVLGGSAGGKGKEFSLASKISLKTYDPMITAELTEDGFKIKDHPGLYEMINDHMRATFPLLDAAEMAYDLAQEIAELSEDPEAYRDKKLRELRDLVRKAEALPDQARELIKEELNKLDKLESEVERQIEEWIAEAGKKLDDMRADAENMAEEVAEEILETAQRIGAVADTVADKAREALNIARGTIEEAVDDVGRELEETADDVRDAAEKAARDLQKKADELRDGAEDVADDLMDAAESIKNAAENAADSFGDAAKGVAREAEEAVQEAKDVAENVAEGVLDTAKNAAQAAEDAVREAADDLHESADNAVDEVVDEVQEAAEKAGQKVKDGLKNLFG